VPAPPAAVHAYPPVSSVPVSAYPTTSAYPPPPPPPGTKSSPWVWILAVLCGVLFLGSGVMGYAYYNATSLIADQEGDIEALKRQVSTRDGTIEEKDAALAQAEDDLATAQADLADAQLCVDAVGELADAQTTAEVDAALDNMDLYCL
jgi:hypothetical protein